MTETLPVPERAPGWPSHYDGCELPTDERELKFAELLFKGEDAVDAVVMAKLVQTQERESQKTMGSRFKREPRIQAAVAFLRSQFPISRSFVQQAFLDIAQDPNTGDTARVNALSNLARMGGLFVDNLNVERNDDPESLVAPVMDVVQQALCSKLTAQSTPDEIEAWVRGAVLGMTVGGRA